MLYHLTNIGPDAEWKVDRLREKFPELPIVYRDFPATATEFDYPGYDEGVAIMNNLHSFGFSQKLTDQEIFEVYTYWFGLKR